MNKQGKGQHWLSVMRNFIEYLNNTKDFPFHVLLDDRTNIKGAILCEHLRTVDLEERKYNKVEKLPENLLEEVLEKVSLIFQ